jgi:orotate phosphoribosyltransferase
MQSETYQQKFIDFLIDSEALRFGDFTTKSGRQTPYFINMGNFDNGRDLSLLGDFYGTHAKRVFKDQFSVVFGPAYKGIPLAIATAMALSKGKEVSVPFSFDRKEEKTHGDKGVLVGHQIKNGDSVIIVEDVVTAGTTFRKIVPFLTKELGATITGAIVAVDRCEKGAGQLSAVQEIAVEMGITVSPIVTVRDIVKYLSSSEVAEERKLSLAHLKAIDMYLSQYGAA